MCCQWWMPGHVVYGNHPLRASRSVVVFWCFRLFAWERTFVTWLRPSMFLINSSLFWSNSSPCSSWLYHFMCAMVHSLWKLVPEGWYCYRLCLWFSIIDQTTHKASWPLHTDFVVGSSILAGVVLFNHLLYQFFTITNRRVERKQYPAKGSHVSSFC